MKFCTKCGNQLADDMPFCQKCGTKSTPDDPAVEPRQKPPADIHTANDFTGQPPKLRTSMKVWMILFFVLTGIFAICCITDASMIAGMLLFGILGFMFLILAKTPAGSTRVFTNEEIFKKNGGLSKNIFICSCVFVSLFLFAVITNISGTNSSEPVNQIAEQNNGEPAEAQNKTTEPQPVEEKPNIPVEFSEACPVSISGSVSDNIIGYPELRCSFKNNTDKEISAIQLYFVPRDVYGEEVDGIFAQNRLKTDSPIEPNGSDSLYWQMLDHNVTSGELYLYSVYFADGTEWGDRNASVSKIKEYGLQIQVGY